MHVTMQIIVICRNDQVGVGLADSVSRRRHRSILRQ